MRTIFLFRVQLLQLDSWNPWATPAGNHGSCSQHLGPDQRGHNIKWDHFDILASGKTDYHCKVKETLFIQELLPAANANVSSEKHLLY